MTRKLKAVMGVFVALTVLASASSVQATDLETESIAVTNMELISYAPSVDPTKGAPNSKQALAEYEANIKPDDAFVRNLSSIDKELYCMAVNNYYEAGGESLSGKVAISEVVMNRIENANFPNTPCGVVKQSGNYGGKKVCQFSWVCNKGFVTPRASKAWYESVVAAIIVYKNKFSGVAHGATHFYVHRQVDPGWTRNGRMVKTATVGNHTFVGPK